MAELADEDPRRAPAPDEADITRADLERYIAALEDELHMLKQVLLILDAPWASTP